MGQLVRVGRALGRTVVKTNAGKGPTAFDGVGEGCAGDIDEPLAILGIR